MNPCFQKLFSDRVACAKLAHKLPEAFEIAEIDHPRAMEVGIARQRILLAFMMWYFGSDEIETTVATDLYDVMVCGSPLSIKTVTRNGGVKAKWTSDNVQAAEFIAAYYPEADMLFVHVWWDRARDSLFYVPVEVLQEVFKDVGRDQYLVSRTGTNNRGVEYRSSVLRKVESHKNTTRLSIRWRRVGVDYDPYQRWFDFWSSS